MADHELSLEFGNDDRWPYEYGSDLHWLWGWAERLKSLLDDENPTRASAPWIFLPDELARDAMTRLSVKYPLPIRSIDDSVKFTEDRHRDFLDDANESTRTNLLRSMDRLCEKIQLGVEVIASAENAPPELVDRIREVLSGKPLKLVEYLLEHNDSSFEELRERVWGADVAESTIRQNRARAVRELTNNELSRINISEKDHRLILTISEN